jgi:CxC4 like cysteine cluster associated with KDZ transposases
MASKKPLDSFPDIFSLDNSSRCSCGNTDYAGNPVTINPYILYTPFMAVQLAIEIVYCYNCSNKYGRIGPDLSTYGILNWNNKIGFAHQVLNQYTSHLTRSETSFNAFYGTIQDEYLSNESPISFYVPEIFEFAWLAFVRLQKIESNMQCSECGPHPKIIIADGISISFPNHHRTETLRPSIISDKTHAWIRLRKTATRSISFIESAESRTKLYDALNTQDRLKRLEKLHPEIEKSKTISVSILCYQYL